jgi:hypothetical protein
MHPCIAPAGCSVQTHRCSVRHNGTKPSRIRGADVRSNIIREHCVSLCSARVAPISESVIGGMLTSKCAKSQLHFDVRETFTSPQGYRKIVLPPQPERDGVWYLIPLRYALLLLTSRFRLCFISRAGFIGGSPVGIRPKLSRNRPKFLIPVNPLSGLWQNRRLSK